MDTLARGPLFTSKLIEQVQAGTSTPDHAVQPSTLQSRLIVKDAAKHSLTKAELEAVLQPRCKVVLHHWDLLMNEAKDLTTTLKAACRECFDQRSQITGCFQGTTLHLNGKQHAELWRRLPWTYIEVGIAVFDIVLGELVKSRRQSSLPDDLLRERANARLNLELKRNFSFKDIVRQLAEELLRKGISPSRPLLTGRRLPSASGRTLPLHRQVQWESVTAGDVTARKQQLKQDLQALAQSMPTAEPLPMPPTSSRLSDQDSGAIDQPVIIKDTNSMYIRRRSSFNIAQHTLRQTPLASKLPSYGLNEDDNDSVSPDEQQASSQAQMDWRRRGHSLDSKQANTLRRQIAQLSAQRSLSRVAERPSSAHGDEIGTYTSEQTIDKLDLPAVPSAHDMRTLSAISLVSREVERQLPKGVDGEVPLHDEHHHAMQALADDLLRQRQARHDQDGSIDPILTSTLRLESAHHRRIATHRGPVIQADDKDPERYLHSHATPRTESLEEFVRSDVTAEERLEPTMNVCLPRISDREPVQVTILQPAPPMCSSEDSKVSKAMLDQLDHPLKHSTDLYNIYNELTSHYHLDTLLDRMLVQQTTTICSPLPGSALLDNSHDEIKPTVRNEQLVRPVVVRSSQPGEGDDAPIPSVARKQTYANRPETPLEGTSLAASVDASKQHREYIAWSRWWKGHLSIQDFVEFNQEQDYDFFPAVYQTLPEWQEQTADESIDEPDEAFLVLQERSRHMLSKKQAFQKGTWNVNSIQIGGLGGEAADAAVEQVLREQSADLDELKLVQTEAEQARQLEYAALTSRLEAVWRALKMPAKDRIGMAIKYSGARYQHPCDLDNTMRRQRLPEGKASNNEEEGMVTDTLTVFPALRQAVDLWEAVAMAINHREDCLARMETFEKAASDPARHFDRASSKQRLQEAAARKSLDTQLTLANDRVTKALDAIKSQLGELVEYSGRRYRQKMKHDVKEMLYWLQQARRANARST
eukprot:TRINITY_DN9258_c0_g1_i3.p1 TRINITY_DN9258_c0_g1~~TRINITY_DN9258_c0_g1_i3.p1  ORF type:complete len:985 (+),score=215.98 TRINITY_DN9258_c0_g1_i3:59-3013(+)